MTGSTSRTPATAWKTSATPRICKLAICVSTSLLLGACGSPRQSLTPRTHDAQQLLSEIEQSSSAEPYYQLALLRYGEGDTDAAVLALMKSLQRDRDYEASLTLLAKLFHDTGRSFEGLDYFARRALNDWPESVRLNIALLHADTGGNEDAREILQSLTSSEYADQARANLAYLDLLDEENMRAREALEATMQRYADHPEVLNNLAIARMRAGDVRGSAKVLQGLVREHPDFAPAQLNLAMLLRHYLFDEEGARVAELKFDSATAPQLSDAMIESLLDANENAAPTLPEHPDTPEESQPKDEEQQP